MPDIMMLASPLLAGVLLGAMYFIGLWWTIRKGMSADRPALWFMGSLVLRTAIAVAGFYLVSGGHWERLLTCLLGFIAARIAVSMATGSNELGSKAPPVEANHAIDP